jgi:hypothetical protein
MPAVGRGRPALTTYLTRVPICASLTLGRAATAATQLRAFNPWFSSVKPRTLCSVGNGTSVGYSRFPPFGAPVRADQVLGTGVPAKTRTHTELKGRPFRRPFFVHQRADQASHRPLTHRAGRTGPETLSTLLNCVAQGRQPARHTVLWRAQRRLSATLHRGRKI